MRFVNYLVVRVMWCALKWLDCPVWFGGLEYNIVLRSCRFEDTSSCIFPFPFPFHFPFFLLRVLRQVPRSITRGLVHSNASLESCISHWLQGAVGGELQHHFDQPHLQGPHWANKIRRPDSGRHNSSYQTHFIPIPAQGVPGSRELLLRLLPLPKGPLCLVA
jgi:hypothetical protein